LDFTAEFELGYIILMEQKPQRVGIKIGYWNWTKYGESKKVEDEVDG
jgi:hypothetical protein